MCVRMGIGKMKKKRMNELKKEEFIEKPEADIAISKKIKIII